MNSVKRFRLLAVTLVMLCFIRHVLLTPVHAANEKNIKIQGDNYLIPAIYTLPETKSAIPFPIVVMLHGTASNKNEVGNLYQRMASQLAKLNIASIRFDFAGSGESAVDSRLYDLDSAVNDIISVHKYIQQQPQVNHNNIGLLGFSQGGLIAQITAVHPKLPVTTLVTWSSVAGNGITSFKPFFEQYEAKAKLQGFAAVEFPWLPQPLNFSEKWFEQVRFNKSFDQMANYKGALLAIAGEADPVVPWQNSLKLMKGASQAQASLYLIKNANHMFNVLADDGSGLNVDQTIAEELLQITGNYFFQHSKQLMQ